MAPTSPIINNLLDSLDEAPLSGPDANPTALLWQSGVAVQWLLQDYLFSWLELCQGAIKCEYPQAVAYRIRLQAIANMRLDIGEIANNGSAWDKVRFLGSLETFLRSLAKGMATSPTSLALQWGINARDIPMAVSHAFKETDFLDDGLPKMIGDCSMLLAFLLAQIVEDEGVLEEIDERMFSSKPRALIELLQSIPAPPEA